MLVGTFMTTPSTQCDGHANNNNDAFWGGIVLVRQWWHSNGAAHIERLVIVKQISYALEEACS